ncbi:MAG: methyl-accepting chemotaxis protein [Myxococcota bacterium]
MTLVAAFLMVGFTGIFAVYFPSQQAVMARDALVLRAESVALALGAAVTPVLDDSNRINNVLQNFATRSGTDSDLAYIVVVPDENNAPLATYLDSELTTDLVDATWTDQTNSEERGALLHTSVPLIRPGGSVATLTVGLSTQTIGETRASGRASILIVGAIVLIFGLLIAWLVGGQIATPLLKAATKLDEVSGSLAEAARDQEASSAQEAAAVAETRRSMETLLDSAQQIADRSSEVLGNAERSANGSRQIGERIGALNELSEKVADILGTIMQVADKADLLALNASLEGTRAGEAGKGFALVASEMRRLAENVMESVAGIRELLKDIREASQAAVMASEEGNKSSTATTRSARQIALLTQDQRSATEQVIASMDEMGEILNHTLDGIQRTTTSAKQLTELAGTLSQVVNPTTVSAQLDEDLTVGEDK